LVVKPSEERANFFEVLIAGQNVNDVVKNEFRGVDKLAQDVDVVVYNGENVEKMAEVFGEEAKVYAGPTEHGYFIHPRAWEALKK